MSITTAASKSQSYRIPIIKEYFCSGQRTYAIVGYETISESYSMQYNCSGSTPVQANSQSARYTKNYSPLILNLTIAGAIEGNATIEKSASNPEICGEPSPESVPLPAGVSGEGGCFGSYSYTTYSYSVDGDGLLVVTVTFIEVHLCHKVTCGGGVTQLSRAYSTGSVGGAGVITETRTANSSF